MHAEEMENEITGFAAKRAAHKEQNFNLQVKNEKIFSYHAIQIRARTHSKESFSCSFDMASSHFCARVFFFYELNSNSYAEKTTIELCVLLCGCGELQRVGDVLCVCVLSREANPRASFPPLNFANLHIFLICPT
jgi:hypothetical protein